MQSHRSPLFKMKVNLGNTLGNPTSITKYHRLHGLNNRNGKQKYSHLSGGQKFKIRLNGWVLKRVLFPVSRWLSSHCVFTWPFLNVRLVLKTKTALPLLIRSTIPFSQNSYLSLLPRNPISKYWHLEFRTSIQEDTFSPQQATTFLLTRLAK